MTKQERMGLKTLKDNPHILIKMADKRSAVVVMNTTDYLREGYRQLQDQKFYQKLHTDITNQVSDKITEELIKLISFNLITEKKL